MQKTLLFDVLFRMIERNYCIKSFIYLPRFKSFFSENNKRWNHIIGSSGENAVNVSFRYGLFMRAFLPSWLAVPEVQSGAGPRVASLSCS